MSIPQSNLKGAALALTAFGIYATSDVIVKYLGGSYNPFQNIFFSQLFGFPLVAILMMTDRSADNLIPRVPKLTLMRSGLTVLNALCSFYAFAHLHLAEAYPIFFSAPLLITLFAIPMLGEKVGMRRGVAVLVGLVGVLVVVRPTSGHFGPGHLAALASAAIFALNSVLLRKIGGAERSVVLMLYPMLANFIVAGCALPFVYKPLPIQHLGMLAAMASLGFVAGLVMIAAYRRAPAVIVAPMHYSQIIWAVIYGSLIFHESHDAVTFLGTAIIIASGLYIVLRERQPQVSLNRPVLETPTTQDMGLTSRLSAWQRLFGRRSPRAVGAGEMSRAE